MGCSSATSDFMVMEAMVSTADMVTRAAPRGRIIPRTGWAFPIRVIIQPLIMGALRDAVSRTMALKTAVVSRIMVLRATLPAGPATRAAAGKRRLIAGCRLAARGVAATRRATLRHRAAGLPGMA